MTSKSGSAAGRAVGENVLQEALTLHDQQERQCLLRHLTRLASADGHGVGDDVLQEALYPTIVRGEGGGGNANEHERVQAYGQERARAQACKSANVRTRGERTSLRKCKRTD